MPWRRTYTDKQLIDAVATAKSWRGTLRELGLASTSAAAMRSVRSHADRLRLDHSHFTGQRRWTEHELRAAVATARSWREVVEALGLQGGSAVATVKGHASRLGLDIAHLTAPAPLATNKAPEPDASHLSRAGSLMAGSWFTLCGQEVSWPLEPCRYDLVVSDGQRLRRVQVKTTTTRVGRSWQVFLSTTHRGRRTYDPDEIDEFFIIDGDLAYYLIPAVVVGGLHAIHLNAYKQFRLQRSPSKPREIGTDDPRHTSPTS